jgi:hypothetical protein
VNLHAMPGPRKERDISFGFQRDMMRFYTSAPLASKLVVTYAVAFLIFLQSYIAPFSPLSVITRVASGFIVIIAIPGIVLSTILLPSKALEFGIALLLGLVIQIFGIHFIYVLALVFGHGPELIVTVLISSTTISIAGLSYIYMRHNSAALRRALGFEWSSQLIGILVVASIMRLVLFAFAQGCLAPDSALYADFARSIQHGEFGSSVLNDGSVTNLTNGVDYIAHHAFTYLFAVSWLLMAPTTSGPVTILLFIGLLILLPIYTTIKRYFGKRSALWVSSIIAIHPLFVFHSVVGYGPEIASLLFLTYAALLLSGESSNERGIILGAGLLVGLVDVTWYANFFIACSAFPLIWGYQTRIQGRSDFTSTLLLPLVALARVFFTNLVVFYSVWFVLFLLLALFSRRRADMAFRKDSLFYAGIAVVMIAWRLPVQLNSLYSGADGSLVQTIPLVSSILSPYVLHTIPMFIFFLVVHLSPGLFILLLLSLIRGSNRGISRGFVIVGLLASLGTLMVLSRISGSLDIIYFYSDSRFFLLIILMFTLATAGYFTYFFREPGESIHEYNNSQKCLRQWRIGAVAALIIFGLVPSYLLMPTGLVLINMEDRYGWKDLPSIINSLGDEDTIFLANRVREFSWYTGRRCAFLEFSDERLPNLNASLEMVGLALNFSAQYLLIDDYTIAKWKTLEFLLYSPIPVGETIGLNATYIDEIQSYPNITIARLTLVGETEANIYGRMSRVYSLDMLNPIDLARAASERHFIKIQRCVLGRWEIEQAPATISVTQHPPPTL